VVYVHGAGGTWLTDGNVLRQFAELGMAAVGFDYDQTNAAAFDGEFAAVLDYVGRQSWAVSTEGNEGKEGASLASRASVNIAWVGFSQGAQETLAYLVGNGQTNRMDADLEVGDTAGLETQCH
jgi:hypothetical protein